MNASPLRDGSFGSSRETNPHSTKFTEKAQRAPLSPARSLDLFQDLTFQRNSLRAHPTFTQKERPLKASIAALGNLESLSLKQSNEYGLNSNSKTNIISSPYHTQNSAKNESRRNIYELHLQKKSINDNTPNGTVDTNDFLSGDKRTTDRTPSSSMNGSGDPGSHAVSSGYPNHQPIAKLNTGAESQPSNFYVDRLTIETTGRSFVQSEADGFLNAIRNAQPNETIHLPRKTLKIGTLFINKPLKFVGYPDAFLDITESIIVDLSSSTGQHNKVLFSECTINFQFLKKSPTPNQSLSTRRSKDSEEMRYTEKKSYSDNISGLQNQGTLDMNRNSPCGNSPRGGEEKSYPLFTVRPDTVLELRDCEIKSLNFVRELGHDTPNLTDIAFLMKYSKVMLTNKDKTSDPTLILKNCRINKFFTAIQNISLCTVLIEKCYIAENRGHAINLSNPMCFAQRETTIDRSGKSSINIRFSKGVDATLKRRIVIENSEFMRSSTYGISIFGENMIHQTCKILIQGNRIICPKKDGIGIKNLNINETKIIKNSITESQGNGIFLQNIIDSETSGQVELRENKIYQSLLYGLTIIDVSVFSEKDEFISNEKGGIIISGGDNVIKPDSFQIFKSHPLRCIFNHSNINNNKDSGVIVVGCLKGPAIFNSCEIYENMNGVYMRMKPVASLMEKSVGNNTQTQANQSLGHVLLDKCNIFQNKDSGLYLKSLSEILYFRETYIQENKRYAVFLAEERDKVHMVLEKGKLKHFINGYIGGDWGLLYDEREKACKGNKCIIF